MTRRLKLSATTDQFDALHSAADRTRKGSTTVKVDRSALEAVLADHSKLIALHQGKIEET